MLDSSIIELLGTGTLGGVATMIVQKVLNSKKDKKDIETVTQNITMQTVELMNTANEQMKETIKELQEIVCYVPNCDFRINGKKKEDEKK